MDSWGETQKVEGEIKGHGHGENDGIESGAKAVVYKKWETWERERREILANERNRRSQYLS